MSFPQYPEYKDSGVEWLGEVPKEWVVSKLGYYFAEPPCYGVLVPDFDPGGVPMLRITDMESEHIYSTGLTTISPVLSRQYSRTIVQVGDVVLSLVGTIGKAFEVTQRLEGVNLSRAIARLQLKADTLPRYLCWIFQSEAFSHFTDLVCRGTAQRVLNISDLVAFRFTFPPYKDQVAISAFLDHETARIDALVEEQQRLIELLKEKRQAVISHAVTKGLDPEVPMKDSRVEWLGEVPSAWVVSKLGYFFAEPPCYGVLVPDFDPFGIPMLRITDMESEYIDSSGLTTISPELSRQYSRTIVQEGDVVLSLVGTIGKAFEVTQRLERVNLSRAIARLQLKADTLPRYLCWIFQSEAFSHFTDLVCRGTAQRVLNISDLTAFLFAFPPYENQAEISAFLDKETTRIDILVKEGELGIKLLQERRSALISAAVTGKIDVRDWMPPASSSAPEATQTEMI